MAAMRIGFYAKILFTTNSNQKFANHADATAYSSRIVRPIEYKNFYLPVLW
jgi:hypothetical protein